MKKCAIKTSGIFTLIFSIILLVLSVVTVLSNVGVEAVTSFINKNNILNATLMTFGAIMIGFPLSIVAGFVEISTDMMTSISQILSYVLVAFSLLMFFWGIKEIKISKKSDEDFSKCKRTCSFMMFFKFLIFAVFTAEGVMFFVIDDLKALSILMFATLGISFEYTVVVIYGALAFISLLLFVLATTNLSKGSKFFLENIGLSHQNGEEQDFKPQGQGTGSYMQANMPSMPSYKNQVTTPQPINPATLTGNVKEEENTNPFGIVPGENGVPLNITEKGIADLERLERLKKSGAISEENYNMMKQRICTTNIS